jgi:hypothetical protein
MKNSVFFKNTARKTNGIRKNSGQTHPLQKHLCPKESINEGNNIKMIKNFV